LGNSPTKGARGYLKKKSLFPGGSENPIISPSPQGGGFPPIPYNINLLQQKGPKVIKNPRKIPKIRNLGRRS